MLTVDEHSGEAGVVPGWAFCDMLRRKGSGLRITFPHMGILYSHSSLLKELGLDVVVRRRAASGLWSWGLVIPPVCLPAVDQPGNYLEAMGGADAILMAGGWGPCRFGYYAQVGGIFSRTGPGI